MTLFLYLIFFLSGAAALVFETIWFRLAGIMFGNSVWSASLILGGFMAGLGIGNYLVTRYGAQLSRPVRAYAWLEVAIGITGMSLILLFPFFERMFVPVFRPFLDTPWMLNLLRLGGAFLLIIVPTSAMGATLPVLVKALCRDNQSFGLILGRLYGMNTVGAVAGALLGEMFLIRIFGLRGAGLAAVSLNFAAASFAFILAARPGFPKSISFSGKQELLQESGVSAAGRRILTAAFLAGGIMLSLEVVWFRFLLLTKGGTSLVFAVMLAVVLAGIGIGGLIGSWWYSYRRNAHASVRVILMLAGMMIVFTYRGFRLAYNGVVYFHDVSAIFSTGEFAVLALSLMLPVSIVSGIVFTLLGGMLREEIPSETGAAGALTLSNTIGAMAGSFLAGFVLLPYVGMERSFFWLAACYGMAALVVPVSRTTGLTGKQRWLMYAAGAGMAASLLLFPFGMMEKDYFRIVDEKMGDQKRIAVRETATETISYYRKDVMDEPYYYRLVTNGHSMSGTELPAKRYMKLYVYLPVALHPNMKKALLISYGVGSTAKALTDTGNLESIDIVDISQDVLDMSSLVFPDPADHPLHDPRVRVYIEDGRFFLHYTEKQYDLITSEPPPPKNAGIVNLYTQEYFELIASRLSDGGYVSYWLPVLQLYEEETKSIIKAFCNAFKDCTLWAGSGQNWMLLGARNAVGPIAKSHFVLQWDDPRVGPEMRNLGFETPGNVGALFMADSDDLRTITESSLPLTDNFPHRLTTEPKPVQDVSSFFADLMDTRTAVKRFQKSAFIRKMWPEEMVKESLLGFPYQRMYTDITAPEYRQKEHNEWDDLYLVLTRTELRTLPLWMFGLTQQSLEIFGRHKDDPAYRSEAESYFALGKLAERDYGRAAKHFKTYLGTSNIDGARQKYPFYLLTLCLAGQKNKAEKVAETAGPLLGDSESARAYWQWLDRTCGVRHRKD